MVTAADVANGEANPDDDIGAAAHTNNAGELSAMYYALRRVASRPAGREREVVHTDSLYAMHMTTGHWMPRKRGRRNEPLIARLRTMWRALQRNRPGEVELRHVRSHIRVPGNELADWLADQGRYAFGLTPMTTDATRWIAGWLRTHGASATGDGGASARPPGDG